MEIFINYLVSIYIKKYIIYNNKLLALFLNNNLNDNFEFIIIIYYQ